MLARTRIDCSSALLFSAYTCCNLKSAIFVYIPPLSQSKMFGIPVRRTSKELGLRQQIMILIMQGCEDVYRSTVMIDLPTKSGSGEF